MDFDLGLLQSSDESPYSVFYDGPNNDTACINAVSFKTLDQQMEEDEIGLLESSSDLQNFINMASGLEPEVQGDDDVNVEKVITDVHEFLQTYDNGGNSLNQHLVSNDAMMSNEVSKEEASAANDMLDELLKLNDITDEEEAPVLSSEDLSPEEMAAGEAILDEMLKSHPDFDLFNEQAVEEQEQQPTTIETSKYEAANDSGFIDIKDEAIDSASGFIDITNAQHITVDGQDIFIVVAPPSPVPEQKVVTFELTAPESFATTLSDDPDWTPESPKASKGRPPVKRTSLKAKSSRKNPGSTTYIKDKKERKKQQNVEAARRYRDKKKSEIVDVVSEEQTLTEKNKGLKSEVADLEVKVRTMKQLMVELGILKQA